MHEGGAMKEFIKRLSDVFYYAFMCGTMFCFGCMIASPHPVRSGALMVICLAAWAAMAQIYNAAGGQIENE